MKHNFYQDFRLITESERGPSNPVVFVLACISTSSEHEITSYIIKTMYIRDGKDMDFTFCISSDTGLFDLYFGDEEIDNMEVFAIHLQTEHNQFFVDGIHRLADALRPCMGVGPTHINFSKKTVVCRIRHWGIIARLNTRHKYTHYHSHRCSGLLQMLQPNKSIHC